MRREAVSLWLVVALLCWGCGEKNPEVAVEETPAPTVESEPDDSVELTGKPRILFISSGRRQELRIYMLDGKTANLLDCSADTRCVGLPAAAEGDGLLMSSLGGGQGLLLHSGSTYRVRGRTEPIEPRDALLTFETTRLVVEEIECIETGTGTCEGYPAIRVPPTGDGSGWVPVLPDSVNDKTGVFVQNGVMSVRAEMMKVPSREEPILIPAIRSMGSIKINEPAEWAKLSED